MEHSPPGRQPLHQAVLLGTDLLARLAVPVALLALAWGAIDASIAASAATVVLGTVRGVVLGICVEAALRRSWSAVAEATRFGGLTDRVRATPERVTVLVEAVRESALYDVAVMPQMWSQTIGLLLVAAAVVLIVGVEWLLLGAAVFAGVGAVVVWGQRNMRRANEAAWAGFVDLIRDMHALVAAGLELRAHDMDARVADGVRRRAAQMARGERLASFWGALTGLVPAGLALISLAAPLRAGLGWAERIAGSTRAAELAILASTAVVLGIGLARSAEAALRSAPHRRAVADLMKGIQRGAKESSQGSTAAADLREAVIDLEGLSHVYPAAAHATPAAVDYHWRGKTALALVGGNGAGKSTLAMILLGLLAPTRGRVTVSGIPLTELDLRDLRRRVAYLPQGAFLAPSASVGWHMRLFAPKATDPDVEGAAERVGLLQALREHAGRTGSSPLEVPAGELSGGERQRMHLARILLRGAELIVLDEPEIGLDETGRRMLRDLVAELALSHRLLLIAHDESVIPPSFDRLVCGREPLPDVCSEGGAPRADIGQDLARA